MNIKKQKHLLSGDSKSLWNFTSSPGWTSQEIEVLKKAVLKYGMGSWKAIGESMCLPGKTAAQMNLQTQRLCGQQALGDFFGIHMDVDDLWRINAKRKEEDVDPRTNKPRTLKIKNGCIINQGVAPTPTERKANNEKYRKEFEKPEELYKSIVLEAATPPPCPISIEETRQKQEELRSLKSLMALVQKRLDIIQLNNGTHLSQIIPPFDFENFEYIAPTQPDGPFGEHQELLKSHHADLKKMPKEKTKHNSPINIGEMDYSVEAHIETIIPIDTSEDDTDAAFDSRPSSEEPMITEKPQKRSAPSKSKTKSSKKAKKH